MSSRVCLKRMLRFAGTATSRKVSAWTIPIWLFFDHGGTASPEAETAGLRHIIYKRAKRWEHNVCRDTSFDCATPAPYRNLPFFSVNGRNTRVRRKALFLRALIKMMAQNRASNCKEIEQ